MSQCDKCPDSDDLTLWRIVDECPLESQYKEIEEVHGCDEQAIDQEEVCKKRVVNLTRQLLDKFLHSGRHDDMVIVVERRCREGCQRFRHLKRRASTIIWYCSIMGALNPSCRLLGIVMLSMVHVAILGLPFQ